ncbi:hypothetical protein RND71_014997 [Anisodus tanguticus]|uniref:Myotubularin phosphatase domain-containing protein n=1 Tax=Anisodus tanguticus TaxID=243964 RepID=A0AAE1VFI8_9SOLA|nr:hypothetical protein RND71_014997 [Anisodus tanguticus]
MRQGSGSSSSQAQNTSHVQNQNSPIFLQWVDCVSQLLRMYPFAFEFSSAFLVDLLDCMLSCRFGNFCATAELRASEGSSHAHYNLFYDPLKHDGPLLPPAAALAPTVWPQFHLRWVCPSEAQGGEVEAECRKLSRQFSELQRNLVCIHNSSINCLKTTFTHAKVAAEARLNDINVTVESLIAELRNEKLVSTSARDGVKRASKETATITRAVQSLGFNVYFSADGDCNVGIERNPTEIPQRSVCSVSTKDSNGSVPHSEKAGLSEPVTVMKDNVSDNPFIRVCGSLCPMHTKDGGCRWPNADCAQFQSQFVGLKANFDAFDRLSIYDSYFGT